MVFCKMKKRLLIFAFYFLPVTAGFAQGIVDELNAIIQQNKQDSVGALAYNRLALLGEDYGVPDADRMIEKALQVSRHVNSKAQTAFALLNKALAITKKGKYDTAIAVCNQAREILKQTDTITNREVLSVYYYTRGMILLPQGSFKDETLASFLKALELSKNSDFKYLTAICYSGVGTAYNYLRQFEHSINIYKEFLDFAGKTPVDSLILAKALNNLGAVYLNTGDKATAVQYFKDFDQLLPRLNSPYLLWLSKNNSAQYLMEDGKYNDAIQNVLQAIEIANANNLSPFNKLASYYLSGYIYYLNNDFTKGIAYMDSTYSIAAATGSQEYVMYAASGMAEIEGKLGNYKSAAEYLTLQSKLADSISNEKSKINANFLNIQYQTAQKETQIKLQQSSIRVKNIINYILVGSALALSIVIFLLYRNHRSRQKLQQQRISELETEKQLLATQSLLQGQEDERSRIAKDLHDGLGGLLSGVKLQLGAMKGNLILSEENGMVFNRVLNNLEESIAEMRRVAHNMMPETLLKFGLPQALQDYSNGLSLQQPFTIQCEFIGMEKRFDNSTEVVIYRIVQELINNAVKHSGATAILVQIIRHDEERINITVEDNGKGFDANQAGENTAGLRNIRSRVKYLNGKMDIQSGPGIGTSIYIECEIKPYG